MTRAIKFRAWVPGVKQMRRLGEWTFEFVGEDGALQMMSEQDSSIRPIPPGSLLMQFTGLKDKNGREIYEGDIVAIGKKEENDYCQVVWHDKGASFRYAFDENNWESPLNYEEVEVIGNIYENPSFLQ